MLGAVGGDEVEGYMGSPADVLVRKGSVGALVAPTNHTLADKVGPPHHEHQQDDCNDRDNGFGVGARDEARGDVL